MIAGLIPIIIGVLSVLGGVGGTAKMKIEGLAGGIVITITGVGGIILIVFGTIMLSVPA